MSATIHYAGHLNAVSLGSGETRVTPSMLVDSLIELIVTISAHSSPHTSTYTGRFFWGKFL